MTIQEATIKVETMSKAIWIVYRDPVSGFGHKLANSHSDMRQVSAHQTNDEAQCAYALPVGGR
ncbi:MAG: hypothetical protein JWM11_6639 [Planctomycetaceae bacterium]|nr:hypothetical protein [Planctomycetaceae bacterium]